MCIYVYQYLATSKPILQWYNNRDDDNGNNNNYNNNDNNKNYNNNKINGKNSRVCTFKGLFKASWMSSLFLMIVASSLRSNDNRSMYACDSGTKSRT